MHKGKIITAIGLMSGTSMDGIDASLIRSDGEGVLERLAFEAYPYSPKMRALLEQALEDARQIDDREDRPGSLAEAEEAVTAHHVEAVRDFLRRTASLGTAELIGFHGQTVLHRPAAGLTVQLGDGRRLARETGIQVVWDLRANDMAHGGQGAPLVPVYHRALANGLTEPLNVFPVAFVNIGGISNITFVGRESEIIAFDTGPGNALIDQWVQAMAGIPYDQGGAIASEGHVVTSIVQRYMAESFFEQTVPKSLDRNDFKPLEPSSATLEDGARTLANVTAEAIWRASEHLPEPPALWILCGGGRHNRAIRDDLAGCVQGAARAHDGAAAARVILAEEAGLDGDAMEAEAWAYLAIRSLGGLPLTWPSTTGCRKPVTGGRLDLPGKPSA